MLAEARVRGFLGPGPVEDHLAHSAGFAAAWAAVHPAPPERVLDLGSGGGVPGLVLAVRWSSTEVVLLDAQERRAAWLAEAVEALDLASRATVAHGRAEDLGRGPLRASVDLVVARGFGPPPVTAECGVPFLRPAGSLAVAEPPGPAAVRRWPPAGLAILGLREAARTEDPAIVVLSRVAELDDRYPRRVGRPAKRPLW